MEKNYNKNALLSMIALIIAGSVIYELPYLSWQYYDVMLESFHVTDGQMGTLMSVYGTIAMICYLPGGWFADWFSAKKLLLTALISTGILGIWFCTLPSYPVLLVIYALWGITVCLPFWGALMKATRQQGNSSVQGKLYGILEGGRGLVPIIYGMAIVALFSKLGSGERGLRGVLISYTVMDFLGAILVGLFLKEGEDDGEKTGVRLKDMILVGKNVNVWLIALIIFTTYSLYAGMSYITPYLTDFCGVSDAAAASIGLIRTYGIAILGGLLGGVIADKIGSKARVIISSAAIFTVGALAYIIAKPSPESMVISMVSMIVLAMGIFMARGIYFALIDEINIPMELTGAAVGLASIIGFIPDAVIYTIIGNWLENYPGIGGYRRLFIMMFVCGIVCIAASVVLYRRVKAQKAK